jgi:hypothetical protein
MQRGCRQAHAVGWTFRNVRLVFTFRIRLLIGGKSPADKGYKRVFPAAPTEDKAA